MILSKKNLSKYLFQLSLLVIFCTISCDNEPVTYTPALDSDNDGVIDSIDNCPNTPNPDQADSNNNGLGDACDFADADNDGVEDSIDNCPTVPNTDQADSNGNGIGDVCENIDSDGDGINDEDDNCPSIANPDQMDSDGNGIGDACESLTPLNICENGFAGQYPCQNYDLMGYMSLFDLTLTNGVEGNDCWGWKSPSTGKEYALVGTTIGTSFVDISNPTEPILIGILPSATANSIWRDIKVFNNYAFVVSEAPNHGMQVFDLSRLETVGTPPETFNADAHYTEFGNAHNIAINIPNGFAYAVGSNTFSGGAHFIDISNPTTPIAIGGYAEQGYTHDAQVVVYNGPDIEHLGKEIYIGCNESKVVIVDVTSKSNPVFISQIEYSNTAYTHQGWLSEDHNYLFLGDELDELSIGNNTRTLIFDLSDLDNPTFHTDYFGTTNAIDHNLYTNGNTLYEANYSTGLRVLDISGIDGGTINEIGFFDTYPLNNNTNFNGAWSVYPYFPSGNIIISDINGGLFIVKNQN